MTPEEYWGRIGLSEQDKWLSFAETIIRKGYIGSGQTQTTEQIAIRMAAADYMKRLREKAKDVSQSEAGSST